MSFLPSLPPFVPAFFRFFLLCTFLAFISFPFYIFLPSILLTLFLCWFPSFVLATFLPSLLSVSPSSSIVCHAFFLSVLVPLLLPSAHHYMHYANHYGLVALKVMTLLFIDKIRDYLGGKRSFWSSFLRQLL